MGPVLEGICSAGEEVSVLVSKKSFNCLDVISVKEILVLERIMSEIDTKGTELLYLFGTTVALMSRF